MGHAIHLSTPLIAISLLVDLALGDPSDLPHPVRIIGVAIEYGERALHTGRSSTDLLSGAFLTLGVVAGSAAAVWWIIWPLDSIHPVVGALAAVVFAWTTIAVRGLGDAARAVEAALARDDEAAARQAMPALVGRDPESLDRAGMIRATVESVAENSSDGVIAPLLFLFLAGPVGGIAYKAINTLDSMIGYRDDRYSYFGRFAARVDDAVNWIPARLSAICIGIGAQIVLGRGRQSWQVWRADAHKHLSPNAGSPEAAMAGALGIQLGGDAVYSSQIEHRATLGIQEHAPAVSDIQNARAILMVATLAAFLALTLLRAAIALLS